MSERHLQTVETRAKIGASVDKSSWRRRTRDKANDMQSAVGAWEEDFTTPSSQWKRRSMLWEEYPHNLNWDRWCNFASIAQM